MLSYVIRAAELNAMMRLLRDVLDMRITLFDANGLEMDMFEIKEMSSFCRCARRDAQFDARCRACDAEHLGQVQRSGQPAVYRCHAALLEGAVPLHSRSGVYVGAIVFGQYRSHGRPQAMSAVLRRKYLSLPVTTEARMKKVAELLRCLSQHIIDRQLIEPGDSDTMHAVRQFIDEHLDRRISVRELADAAGRSPSFIAHRFRADYGISPAHYARKRRLEAGAQLLRQGHSVRDAAAQAGFCDEFHFSRAFRREMGVSPSQLRTRTP